MGDMPRAQRFSIQTPLKFRASGEIDWKEGETVNISRTGVLFRSRSGMAVRAPVEMSFVLPTEVARPSGATVLCQGEVVRTVVRPERDDIIAVAAKILDYQLSRAIEDSKLPTGEKQ